MGYTKNQELAISLRNRNILVSAAAGSGKTSVLVERIKRRVTDDKNPIDVDRMLIMTFTKAAAKEMRDRIRGAIEDALVNNPADENLIKQSVLIHNAQITTIHGFCQSIIRDHFEELDIDPNFRVGDENECTLLGIDVCEQVLEAYYEEGSENFLNMVESFSGNKSDKEIPDIILKLYKYAESHPDPESFLRNSLDIYSCSTVDEFAASDALADYMNTYLLMAGSLLKEAKRAAALVDSTPSLSNYSATLENDIEQLEMTLKAQSYDDFKARLESISWAGLKAIRANTLSEEELAVKDRVSGIRNGYKNELKKKLLPAFSDSLLQAYEKVCKCKPIVEAVINVTLAYKEAYEAKKRDKNIIDYGDMEHMAIKILSGNPEIAASYRNKFEEIYVDEYQDSNMTQETLINLIKKDEPNGNLFMVGDVKQSIYRFRQARPDLFLYKYNTYTEGESGSQRVLLNDNFRSKLQVINAVNEIFEGVMTEEVGGIAYDESARLKYGASYYDDEAVKLQDDLRPDEDTDRAELIIGVSDSVDSKDMQINIVSNRISEIIASKRLVYDKNTKEYRPVQYKDIVILVRSLKKWEEPIKRIMSDNMIPVSFSSSQGYFTTVEVQTVLAFLAVIDNPMQDIELAAVMKSPIGGFCNKEIAIVRVGHGKKNLYSSIMEIADNIDDRRSQVGEDIAKKCDRLIGIMDEYRRKSVYIPVYELIRELVDGEYGDYVRTMDRGAQRIANLNMLMVKAEQFGNTSFKGLFNFIRYMNLIRKYEIEDGEASVLGDENDVVKIMTIHKSKGLEFPICFVVGIDGKRNTGDERGAVLCDAIYGVGVGRVDLDRRIKSETICKRLIKEHLKQENIAEEIRVLYVATTRARQKLILVGSANDEAVLENAKPDLLSCKSYLDMLGLVYGINKGFKHIDLSFVSEEDIIADKVWDEIRREHNKELYMKTIRDFDASSYTEPAEMAHIAEEYRYKTGLDIPAKLSVSELKHMDAQAKQLEGMNMAPEGEKLFAETDPDEYIPAFMRKENETVNGGTFYGTAFHRILELWDYSVENVSESDVENYVKLMLDKHRIDINQFNAIRTKEIAVFLNSELGRRMYKAKQLGKLRREQPFSLGLYKSEIAEGFVVSESKTPHGEDEDMVLIQGIIDAYIEEDNEIAIIDYKTDYVTEADMLINRYSAQLKYYQKALEQITGKKVKELIIYSSRLKRSIIVE